MRIKEREQAILLITMDPKVYGKLLTLHQRGNGVGVEVLKMVSHGYRRSQWWKSGFVALPDVSRV